MSVPRIPVVYIAGPFRAKTPGDQWEQEINVRRAEVLSHEVWAMGGAADCPHTQTRHFQGSLPDEVWLAGCLAKVAKADAMILVSGWEQSEGSIVERRLAKRLEIPVFEHHELRKLEAWIDERRNTA